MKILSKILFCCLLPPVICFILLAFIYHAMYHGSFEITLHEDNVEINGGMPWYHLYYNSIKSLTLEETTKDNTFIDETEYHNIELGMYHNSKYGYYYSLVYKKSKISLVIKSSEVDELFVIGYNNKSKTEKLYNYLIEKCNNLETT